MQLFPQAFPDRQILQQAWASEPVVVGTEEAVARGDARNPTTKPSTKRRRFMLEVGHDSCLSRNG
jgi:hypothetical protein